MAHPTRRVDFGALVRSLGSRARPEIGWLSEVAGVESREAQDAVDSLTAQGGMVRQLMSNIERTGRSYYAQFPAPIELYAFVKLVHPRTLVESGVSSGVSSAFMLMGVRANAAGNLHSIDLPVVREKKRGGESWAIPQGSSSGWAVPEGLRGAWDVRLGRSEDLLEPLLDEVGTLGLYCHDSPVDLAHFEFEMKAIRKHLKPGSLVISDNTDRDVFDETAESVGAKAFYRRHSSLGAFRVK